MQHGWNRRPGAALAAALGITLGAGAAGAEDKAAAPAPAPAAAPAVKLDRLLKLPDTLEVPTGVDRRGGATRAEWRARFETATTEVASAEGALEKARAELGEVASESSAWKLAAPGVQHTGSDDAPLDYELSKRIRHLREDLDRAQRHLRELQVEANLAGVPEEWLRGE